MTALAHWDVFHSDRLELRRGLTSAEVRAGVGHGEIGEDDLIRLSGGGAAWTRIGDLPALPDADPEAPTPTPVPTPAPVRPKPTQGAPTTGPFDAALAPTIADDAPPVFPDQDDDFELIIEPESGDAPAREPSDFERHAVDDAEPSQIELASPYQESDFPVIPAPPPPAPSPVAEPRLGEFDLDLRGLTSRPLDDDQSSAELVAIGDDAHGTNGDLHDDGLTDDDEYDPLEEDEAVAEFTLSRGSPATVEELDLAAMVDVAFQLVLFFLVTSATVMFKTLEVPKPNPESSPTASATQGRSKTLDELKDDFILVEIDPGGLVKIDHEPVDARPEVLARRLRAERERTHRQAMLLSADFSTPHRSAVLAYDAANEIGLAIAIARPSSTQNVPPAPPSAPAPPG